MHRLAICLIVVACDMPPPDPPDPTLPTTGATDWGGTVEVTVGSTITTATAATTGSDCGGLACSFDSQGEHDCGSGLQCVPHPESGVLSCVAPCSADGCPGPALDCAGLPVPGVCLPDVDGVPSCFAGGA